MQIHTTKITDLRSIENVQWGATKYVPTVQNHMEKIDRSSTCPHYCQKIKGKYNRNIIGTYDWKMQDAMKNIMPKQQESLTSLLPRIHLPNCSLKSTERKKTFWG